MSELQKRLQKSNIGGLPPHPGGSGSSLSKYKHAMKRRKDYTPVKWNEYFSDKKIIKRNKDKICFYEKGNEGPLLVLLHGGGFSALTWALFSNEIVKVIRCRLMAIDLRGHGSTITEDDADLSAETMARDVTDAIELNFGGEPPPIVLIGHSMGGAIAVHIVNKNALPGVIGLAVIDVVEGTAMEALANMQSFLRGRPKSFPSISNAIEWSVRTGHVRNLESAKVSMPGQLLNSHTHILAADEVADMKDKQNDHELVEKYQRYNTADSIKEEDEESGKEESASVGASPADNNSFKEPNDAPSSYEWRIDLSKTEPHWSGWFSGLSSMFLACPAAKLLLLAGVDRLDKELTVGQMQGKFQMQVLGHCGHVVHEDVPEDVVDVIARFLVRNKFTEALKEFQQFIPSC